MPITFTKEEVRDFLHEQGYDVSDEETLRKFIHDLKRLIKHEEMQRRRRKLGHSPEETNLDSTDGKNQTGSGARSSRGDEESRGTSETGTGTTSGTSYPSVHLILGSDNSTSYYDDSVDNNGASNGINTTSSYEKSAERAPPSATKPGTRPKQASKTVTDSKRAPAKKQPGSRLIMKRVTAARNEHGDTYIEESDVDLGPAVRRPVSAYSRNARPQTAPTKSVVSGAPKGGIPELGGGRKTTDTRKQYATTRPTSARDTASRREKQTKAEQRKEGECETEPDELYYALQALIFPDDQISEESLFSDAKPKKPIRPPPHVARDPVALFHWYKTYSWNIYSIPGEDRHMQLRWNVRAKTVGHHPCAHKPGPQYIRQRV